MKAGLLLRWGSFWVGVHWAPEHKRLCVNLLPCVTLWVIGEGGDVPSAHQHRWKLYARRLDHTGWSSHLECKYCPERKIVYDGEGP